MHLPSTAELLEVPTAEELNRIEQDIRRSLSLRIHSLRIRAFDNGLVLDGHTRTYYGKQAVQHAVMNATDFPILANNIVVG